MCIDCLGWRDVHVWRPCWNRSGLKRVDVTRRERCGSALPPVSGMKNVLRFGLTYAGVLLPVLEVCGCVWGLLSALGAVGSCFFHGTVHWQQPDISLEDWRIIKFLSNKDWKKSWNTRYSRFYFQTLFPKILFFMCFYLKKCLFFCLFFYQQLSKIFF